MGNSFQLFTTLDDCRELSGGLMTVGVVMQALETDDIPPFNHQHGLVFRERFPTQVALVLVGEEHDTLLGEVGGTLRTQGVAVRRLLTEHALGKVNLQTLFAYCRGFFFRFIPRLYIGKFSTTPTARFTHVSPPFYA
jgi:hypothetical protein